MLDRPLEAIDEAALNALVANRATEGRHVEFKSDLSAREPDAIREFLADVSSFSNAQGGHLLFGIAEEGGVATGLPGVTVADPDAELLRLENIIRDGMDPRLIGVRLRWVPLASGRHVLVIRVAAGVTAPHRIVYRNSGKFFARNSAGKYEMDVHELRHAFTEADMIPRRFRQRHAEAIERAQGVEMPFSMSPAPTAVVSIMPLALFREERDLALTFDNAVLPYRGNVGNFDVLDMIEGITVYVCPLSETGTTTGMALMHRSGAVDMAWTIGGVRETRPGERMSLVWPARFEAGLVDIARAGPARLQQFGLEGPWVIFASVYGVKDHRMVLGDGYATSAAFRDQALLGELRLEHVDDAGLLPVAKRLWLLFGIHRPEGRPLGQT